MEDIISSLRSYCVKHFDSYPITVPMDELAYSLCYNTYPAIDYCLLSIVTNDQIQRMKKAMLLHLIQFYCKKHIYCKKHKVFDKVRLLIDNQTVRPVDSISGRYLDYQKEIIETLEYFGFGNYENVKPTSNHENENKVKTGFYIINNDAPKGGKLGYFIKLQWQGLTYPFTTNPLTF